jgi:MFS family permease
MDGGTPDRTARVGHWGAAISRNVRVMATASLLTDVSTEMVYPFLPLFLTRTLGAGVAFVGLVEGVAESTASLLKLGSGWLSDRLGRRKLLVTCGYSLSSLTRPLMAVAVAPWHVLATRFLDRVGKGIRTAPRDALLADSTPPATRGTAFGFHRAMDHAGAVIGPVLAFVLLPVMGNDFRSVFWLASVPALACVLLLMAGLREAPSRISAARPARLCFQQLDRRFHRFLAVVCLFTLGNSSDAFLLLRARDAGIADAVIPLLWAALHVVKSISSLGAGILSDRLGRRGAIVAGWLVYAAVYAGFALAWTRAQIWGLFLAYGLYFGLTEGVEKALVADLVPAASRGSAYGLYNTAIGVAALPASLLTGWLWETFGHAVALGAGGALAAVAAVSLWLVLARTSA